MDPTGTIRWTDARCATGDARLLHLFFSEEPSEIAEAKALCGACPLQAACLQGALERREPWGVWGGQLFDRGEVVLRKRARGRPRKEDQIREAEARREIDALRERLLSGERVRLDADEEMAVRQVEVA